MCDLDETTKKITDYLVNVACGLNQALKILVFPHFLSAAKPADQGEESIVLVLVLVVDVVGGLFFSFPCTVFWGVKRQKLCVKRGVKRQNHRFKRGVKRQKLCLKRGVKRQNCVYHGALIRQNAIFHAADQ